MERKKGVRYLRRGKISSPVFLFVSLPTLILQVLPSQQGEFQIAWTGTDGKRQKKVVPTVRILQCVISAQHSSVFLKARQAEVLMTVVICELVVESRV